MEHRAFSRVPQRQVPRPYKTALSQAFPQPSSLASRIGHLQDGPLVVAQWRAHRPLAADRKLDLPRPIVEAQRDGLIERAQ